MADTKNVQHTIKQIIFWLRQIDDYNKVIAFLDNNYGQGVTGKIVEKPRTLVARIASHLGTRIKEVELSDEALVMFHNNFKEYVEHLEGLVAESDPQLVEVAKGIYYGDITSKGLEFK